MLRRLVATVALLAVTLVAVAGCSKDCPSCPAKDPQLYLSKHKLDLGTSATTGNFAIANKGEQTLAWTITISPSSAAAKIAGVDAGGWLSVSQATGSNNATITCTANRAKLADVGLYRAMLIIDAPGAANTVRDSVEVRIGKSDAWLIHDSGVFDSCADVTVDDYFWVKEFNVPQGQDGIIVDSISLNFCSPDTAIELLGYDSQSDGTINYPGQLLFATDYFSPLQPGEGWNTYPVNWYFTSDVFYLGYFQFGVDSPDLAIDTSPLDSDTTGCWTARVQSSGPDGVILAWYLEGVSQTFAIRIHVVPAWQGTAKLQAGAALEARQSLATAVGNRGIHYDPSQPLPRN